MSVSHIGKTAYNKGKPMSAEQKLTISGERNHFAKLTEAQVIEIKQLIKEGVKSGEIAQKFGVKRPLISRIKKGKTWRSVNIC